MDLCQQKTRKLRKNCVYVCKYRPGQFTVVQLVLITISVYFSHVKLTFKPTKVSFSELKWLECLKRKFVIIHSTRPLMLVQNYYVSRDANWSVNFLVKYCKNPYSYLFCYSFVIITMHRATLIKPRGIFRRETEWDGPSLKLATLGRMTKVVKWFCSALIFFFIQVRLFGCKSFCGDAGKCDTELYQGLGRDWGVLGWERNGLAVSAESWSPPLIAISGLMNQIG